ncbi:MAG: mannose-1-phosphate guanylyltransferase [Calditrichia bacterium]
MNVYAVLMAGGVGTRFWPRSRSKSPKQVLKIAGDGTMIQATHDRLKGLVEESNIYVVTNREQYEILQEQLPALDRKNFILEPFGRNTAPCIGLAAVQILAEDPDGVMLVLPADHLITNEKKFRKLAQIAIEFISENDGLITMGIEPTSPSTAYGYIQRGKKVAEIRGQEIYKVRTFAEKPNYETAVRFLDSGGFYWNSGMFIWKASTILKEIADKLPEIHHGLLQVKECLNTPEYEKQVEETYRRIRGISIDYGVMQTSEHVYVIPADFGWNDVGSWETVYDISPKDKNKIAGEYKELVNIDSAECYVSSPEKVIALVGVKNILVVDTGDALLICKKSHSQKVKEVVEVLKKRGLNEFL